MAFITNKPNDQNYLICKTALKHYNVTYAYKCYVNGAVTAVGFRGIKPAITIHHWTLLYVLGRSPNVTRSALVLVGTVNKAKVHHI